MAAVLGASVLISTSACGGKDGDSGGTGEPSAGASAEASSEPSSEASDSPSPTPSAAEAGGPPVALKVALDDACTSVTELDPRFDVPLGRTFELTVKAEGKGCSVHVEGYNKVIGVGDGETIGMPFVADKAGTFRVGIDEDGPKLFDLQVLGPAADRFDADTAARLAITLDEDCKLPGEAPTPKVPQGLSFILTVTSKNQECEVDLRDGPTPVKIHLRDGGVTVYSYVADNKGTFVARVDGHKRFELVVK